MSKKILYIGVSTLAFMLASMLFAQTALAATGVIKGINGSGGNNGALIVSDPRDPSGFIDPGLSAGRELEFTSAEKLVSGDLVDFTYDAASDSGLNARKIGSGVIITGTRDKKVVATATNHVLVINATINAKVTSNGGTIVIIGNSIIDGKVDIDNGSTLVMVNSRIDGKIRSRNNNVLFIRGTEVEGKLSSSGDSYVEITGSTIDGKLELLTKPVNGCNVSNNTVSGRVNVPAACRNP